MERTPDGCGMHVRPVEARRGREGDAEVTEQRARARWAKYELIL